MPMELLAPAGGMEQLRAAVAFGADAVYLAAERFGMRARAANFRMDEIPAAVAFAHEHGVKVHVTCNILMHPDDIDELPAAGQKLDYLNCEHAFQSYYYTTVLAQIDRDLSGRSAADTKRLFRMEAEIYNLDLLFRAKAFFSPQLTPEDLKKLLIPVYGVLSAKNMNALADTRGLDEFLKLYNAGRAGQVYGARSADPADASEVSETRALYRAAQKLLHFSSTPQTVLAALLCLANLERSNIINVIEGVRYGLSPEQISAFLKY